MAEALKPCPFCGGEPSVSTYETESLWSHNTVTYTKVECGECDIGFNTEPGHELQAAAAWNRRADADRIEALEEVVGNTITLCDAMAADTDCPVPGWYAILAALRQGAAAALAASETEKGSAQ